MHRRAVPAPDNFPVERTGLGRAGAWGSAAVDAILKGVLAIAVLGEVGVVFLNVCVRAAAGTSLEWTNEVAEMALSVIALLGGAFAYRRGEQPALTMLVGTFPGRARKACYVIVDYLVLIVAVATGQGAFQVLLQQRGEEASVLHISTSWFVLPIVLGMLVLAESAVERLWAQHRPMVVGVGTLALAMVGLLTGTMATWRPWVAGSPALVITLILFLVPILLGLPVGYALLLGGLIYLYTAGALPIRSLAHTIRHGVNNFVLSALPFFIFAALIMNRGGISVRLVRLTQSLVGHVRGGLLQVMILSMYVVSGLSGSKAADIAAVGSVMKDMLRREGYNIDQAAALLASSAVMGETVPPSIAILVLCSVTTVSVGTLFIAGLMPAAVVAVCLMILVYLQARWSNAQPHPRASFKTLATAALHGILPLCMPAILFGGILSGVATPTEVSSFAVVYGIVLAGFVYGELGPRAFWVSVVECGVVSGLVLFIIGAASCFSRALTIAQLPALMVRALGGVQYSQALFMFVSVVLLIGVGSILEGLPALLIFGPILIPIASQIGIDPIHYSIVMIIATGVGAFMPPVGSGFYVACTVCDSNIEPSMRQMIPYLVVLFLGLLLVAFIPWFTLFLPQAFRFG